MVCKHQEATQRRNITKSRLPAGEETILGVYTAMDLTQYVTPANRALVA
jgi:hypothetical protein